VNRVNLVLVRHGQSVWNQDRRMTGWSDVSLSEHGREEARAVGRILASNGYGFDVAFTSYLQRAAETLDIVLDTLGLKTIPVHRSWRLNERHYGAMQGMSRPQAVGEFGLKQLVTWQSGYEARPPPVPREDLRHPANDSRYAGVPDGLLPATESLRDTLERVMPLWQDAMLPELRAGKRVLVVAHKTSLRALRKHLEGIPDADIAGLTIRTGEPVAYRLDHGGRPMWYKSLHPSGKVKRWAQAAVARWIRHSHRKGY